VNLLFDSRHTQYFCCCWVLALGVLGWCSRGQAWVIAGTGSLKLLEAGVIAAGTSLKLPEARVCKFTEQLVQV